MSNGIEVFDDRLIAVDEFHHVSANPDNKLGDHMRQLVARDKTHIVFAECVATLASLS